MVYFLLPKKEEKMNIKDIKLKEIYLTEEEYKKKENEYIETIKYYFPETINVDLKYLINQSSNFSLSRVLNKTKQHTILFKSGCNKLIDLYLHYDTVGYDFRDALISFYEHIYEDLDKFVNKDKYFSETTFFVEKYAERCFYKDIYNYAQNNLEVYCILENKHITSPSFEERKNKIMKNNETREILLNQIKTLRPREAKVLSLRFGIIDGNEFSCEDIAKKYKVSTTRIMKVLSDGLKKLKRPSNTIEFREQ